MVPRASGVNWPVLVSRADALAARLIPPARAVLAAAALTAGIVGWGVWR